MSKILIAVLMTLAGCLGHQEGPHWDCNAEDEVVVINDTCVHVDNL